MLWGGSLPSEFTALRSLFPVGFNGNKTVFSVSKSSDLVESRAAHQLWFSISLVLTDAETFSHECISQVHGGKLVSCQQLQDWALEEARELGCWYGKVLSTYWHILLLDIDAEFGLCMSKYWVNGSFVVQLRRRSSSTFLVSSWQCHQILCCW